MFIQNVYNEGFRMVFVHAMGSSVFITVQMVVIVVVDYDGWMMSVKMC